MRMRLYILTRRGRDGVASTPPESPESGVLVTMLLLTTMSVSTRVFPSGLTLVTR